jgi:hypothetical protein
MRRRAGLLALALAFALALVAGACAGAKTIDGNSGQDLAGGAPVDLAPAPADLLAVCVEGNPCTTTNPGECARGYWTCLPRPTCVPAQTEQSCYTGPMGTAGVGSCRAGKQSCIGTIGACTGEVRPAAIEDCLNDADDNCNGTVNEGCPDRVEVGPARTLTPRGGTGGGGPFLVRCPANAFVTRAQFFFDTQSSHASGVRIWCATPTLVRAPTGYAITTTQIAPAPYLTQTGNRATLNGEVDCGTGGFTAGYRVDGRADAQYVFGLGLYCATGTVTLNPDNSMTLSLAANGVGSAPTYSGGSAFSDACAANEVLVGYDLRTGDWMDQLVAVCAPLVIKIR